ncbi:DUF6356 family protein [Qipengyuania sediminis]|uniref:DUF6356 family protein n=1 Tax=Qipengyuania sediminis TaxID=1532023 RepID=UPI0010598BA2|nr:DUF6356 family protein [Qipengyuania sediminis]
MSDPDARPGGAFDRLLFAHPRSLGESYAEHAAIAARFGGAMVAGGVKCLVHAIVPAFYARAASDCVAELNGELARRRAASADVYPDYVI